MENDVEDVLTVLALMVHADKRVFAEEIDAFMSAAQLICASAFNGMKPSEAVLLFWFELRRDDIKRKLRDPSFDTWFNALLARVSKLPRLDLIIDGLQSIAEADNEIHISEHALLVLMGNLN